MPERDTLTDLFVRLDQPVTPPAAFAAELRRRLLAQLAESQPQPKEEHMASAALPISPPRIIPLPLPVRDAGPGSAARQWRRVLHLVTAAALLITLTGGALLGGGMLPHLAALWQGADNQLAAPGVPMAGVDPGRTSANPGPAPAGTPELKWNVFAGVGTHPPIVVDGIAYVAGDSSDVVAFDAGSGAELWRAPIGAGTDTPTYAAGVLYVSLVTDSEIGNSGGALIALDAASGAELWQMPTGTFGGASPVVVDGVAYAGGDQELYAFDAATGEQLWVYALDAAPCVCSPRPVAVAAGVVYVVPGGQQQASLFAVDAASGAELWRYDGQLTVESPRFTDPVVADGRVFIGEGNLMQPVTGRFVGLDAATGEEAWAVELDASAPPAVVDGLLYLQTRVAGAVTGTIHALDAGTGDELWQVSTWDVSLAAPAVADGLVLVPSGTRDGYAPGFDDVLLSAYEAETGNDVWQVDLAGSISGSPAIVDGEILVTTYSEGVLFALGEGEGDAAGTPAPAPAVDLSGREACPGTITGDPDTQVRSGTPVPAVTSPGQAENGATAADMPSGEPASDEVVAAMNATLRAFASCTGGDPALLYGFFSDDFFTRAAESMEAAGVSPNAEIAVTRYLPPFSPFADLTIQEARVLPDGRVGGFFDGGFNPIFAVFVEQDGAWLIDELGAVADPDRQPGIVATPSP